MAVLRHRRDTLFDNAVGRKADELHPAEPDRAGGWLDEARDGVEERRLAGAVRAEDRNRLAALHANRDIVQRTMAAVPMVEAVDLKHRRRPDRRESPRRSATPRRTDLRRSWRRRSSPSLGRRARAPPS